jgi:hypothetical protein
MFCCMLSGGIPHRAAALLKVLMSVLASWNQKPKT